MKITLFNFKNNYQHLDLIRKVFPNR